MIAALFALLLVGVVDQVDAGWASVEWEGRAFGFVREADLPEGTREGDRIILRTRRRGALIELPEEIASCGCRLVRASIHPPRGARRPKRRTQCKS